MRFSLIVLAVLSISQLVLAPAVDSVAKSSSLKAAVDVASGSMKTYYFHNWLNLTDAFLLLIGWPNNGSVFVFNAAHPDPPGPNPAEQRVKCLIKGPEICRSGPFGLIKVCRTPWGGLVGWKLTEKLEHTVKMKGLVDFYVWMKSISMDSGGRDGAGVIASLLEIDPSTQKIVWTSEIGQVGGRDWDMSEYPTEYHIQLEVNHIFRNGSMIAFFAGIANTNQGREAVVYFDDVERPSRVEVPWDEEWRPPPPEYRVALVDYMGGAWDSSDDLEYLGYSFDTYTEKNITSLFGGDTLSSYSALFIATYACDPDPVEPYFNQIYANFSANKELVKSYVEAGGGLVVLAHETYDWLPDDLSEYTQVKDWTKWEYKPKFIGLQLELYYAAHKMTTYPNDLAHERTNPEETTPKVHYLYRYYFDAWGNPLVEPPGTYHGIYQSIGYDRMLYRGYPIGLAIWIAGTYGEGRVTITTMNIDFHSGDKRNWGIPFYDGREAIENMLRWVCRIPYPHA